MRPVRRVDLDSARSGQAHYPNIPRPGSKQRVNLGLQVPLILAGISILAAAIGSQIPKPTLADRNWLSQWIDQQKKQWPQWPDEPSAKQLAFTRSLAERKQIEIEGVGKRGIGARSPFFAKPEMGSYPISGAKNW